MKSCVFIFGFGYTAKFLTEKFLESNFRVIGTTRKEENFGHYDCLEHELVDFSDDGVAKYFSTVTHILVSTPPSYKNGDPVIANFSQLIKKFSLQIQWLGYLSSTSVYGDHQGELVDETASSISLGKQGQLRLDAENAWISLANDYQLPLHIFRLAGIYGPKRNALVRLFEGKQHTIYKEKHYFSRIHVEDIASIILSSIQYPNPISIYNVADDEPAPSEVIDAYAASLLNVQAIPLISFEVAKLSPMENEFYSHNRRVSNTKIKKELLIQLKYPSYKEGLKELLKNDGYFINKSLK